jgi:hypothetical protein
MRLLNASQNPAERHDICLQETSMAMTTAPEGHHSQTSCLVAMIARLESKLRSMGKEQDELRKLLAKYRGSPSH